jgi:hypothetical protein
MTTKIQRVRRIAGLVVGAVKAIFRTGRVWGSTRSRVATARRPAPAAPVGAAAAVGVAGGAAGAYFLDSQNGKRRREAVLGRVTAMQRNGSEPQADADPEPATEETAAVAD